MPPRSTRVPLVIDRLVDVLTPHPDLAEALVLGGPIASGDYKDVTVIIGWTDADRPAATTTRKPAGSPIRPRDEETWTIWCLIGAVDGDTDEVVACKAARDKAAAALAVVEYLVTDDPQYGVTLGDVCGQISIGEQEWWQTATGRGHECAILFRLSGKALL